MKEFWENQAKQFKGGMSAVNFDLMEEELEHSLLMGLLRDNTDICDVGCGNGRLILHFAEKLPGARFFGMDFSENMVASAREEAARRKIGNAEFAVADATAPGAFAFGARRKFDTVISKRLLINTKGRGKYTAADNILEILKPGGRYLMIECFIEPLQRVNDIRNTLGLPAITVKEFNEYLTEGFVSDLAGKFTLERKVDFESLYYFISRVFNAGLSSGQPKYDAPINKLAVKLALAGVAPIEGLGPETLHIWAPKSV
ncbi:MAG: class I SAM-dependent methyltransferase [Elusimicrobiales bacterium]|nr:class I SAM-dependent methyltransferase [Elusimicrobiales bacterium]